MIERAMDERDAVTPQRKPKKTRRGKKKKKQRGDDDAAAEAAASAVATSVGGTCVVDDYAPYQVPDRSKRGGSRGDPHQVRRNNNQCCILRPVHVPQAPKNSTQFIIDDHEDSNLYFSFEPSRSASEDALSSSSGFLLNVDTEYESPDDLDTTTAFYERDFEMSYRRAREDELQEADKELIVDQYVELERRVLELERQLERRDPRFVLTGLQTELLRLQDENSSLVRQNAAMRRHHRPGDSSCSSSSSLDDDDDEEEEDEEDDEDDDDEEEEDVEQQQQREAG